MRHAGLIILTLRQLSLPAFTVERQCSLSRAELTKNNGRIFCGRACAGRRPSNGAKRSLSQRPARRQIEVPCEQCGKLNLYAPNRVERGGKLFCPGGKCYGAWLSANHRGAAIWNFKGGKVEVRCAECGASKILSRHHGARVKRHFCDHSCQSAWRKKHGARGTDHPSYKQVEVTCPTCRKPHHRRPHRLNKRGLNFCSRKCKETGLIGPLVGTYRTGYTSRTRTPEQALMFAINSRMKAQIRHALKGGRGRGITSNWETWVGYTAAQLHHRLKRTMPAGYTWDDFLAGRLEIDHKTPLSVFRFTEPDEPDFRRCWALANLRLLPKADNRRKHAKLLQPFQQSLL